MASGGRHRVFGVISPSGSPDRDDQTKLNKSDLQSRPPFSSFILIFFFFFIRLNTPHRFRNRRATKFTEEQRVKQKELLEVSAPPVSKARFTFSLFHTRTVPFWRGDDDNRFIFIIRMISVIMYTAAFLPSRARGTKRLTRFMRYCLVASFPPDRVFTHSQEAGLERYAIAGKETDWDDALVGKKVPKSGMLSVKRKHGDGADASTPEKKSSKKDKKGDKGHKMKGAKTPKSSSKKSKHKA